MFRCFVRSAWQNTYVSSDLILKVSVLDDLAQLLLLLFFGAGASGTSYSMLISFSISRLSILVILEVVGAAGHTLAIVNLQVQGGQRQSLGSFMARLCP